MYNQVKLILKKERSASRQVVLMVAQLNNNEVDYLNQNTFNRISRDLEKLESKNI
jgi:hypothetical protein